MGYEFARRYGIEGAYENYLQRYYEDVHQWQNRSDFRYSASFFYNLSPKTAVFAQYRNTAARYDGQNDGDDGWNSNNSQDYKLSDYFLGARFKPGEKLSGEIKVGYGQKNFNNRFDKDGFAYTDGGTWIAESRLDYQMQERTLLSLNFQRGYKSSPFAESASYLDTLIGLELRQKLLAERLALNIGVDFETNEYSNENRNFPDRK
ncbi:MAG: outer membrane beta-barrel protein, partial [Desulfobacteraceae bacterium]|nr:outer membrane beta-barrel protein [Desulfobacteraceae bacterium]